MMAKSLQSLLCTEGIGEDAMKSIEVADIRAREECEGERKNRAKNRGNPREILLSKIE